MNIVKTAIRKVLKSVIYNLPPKLLNNLPIGLPEKSAQWSIGIYTGKSHIDLTADPQAKNPVISRSDVSDVYAGFVADPFMLKVEQTWYMFFEVFNNKSLRGEIGLATSQDGRHWKYQKIILAEPFHLSYPHVFEWMGEYYMIPESFKDDSIRLYKASNFPTTWNHIGNIMTGGVFLDSSVIRYHDKWWLFTETNPQHKYDTLRLYSADDLLGSWQEHPLSPLIENNPHIARPGGRVIAIDNKIIRYTQDCNPEYGIQVRAFEIDELTTTTYREQEISQNPILIPSGIGWNGSGMHHIDPYLLEDGEWIACVDGRVKI
ncbi:glucosamine inositolphosphorylceramide transferase family protein [Brunnivagina elsteri]|uniref:Glucosamine inositolphosphorylceramide transferase 1 N-terminal domain-containing protein n=1 Tax=Brunnivagina elsteri CCALA 953 TaxID=987040 RepID=A0A2A2TIZ6_9CYAN|nr:hypothetical protein [Calothrix elsteri]PAX53974.1 hypothetical protein CK510_12985 [Calothrix elsteri CCALA 953]